MFTEMWASNKLTLLKGSGYSALEFAPTNVKSMGVCCIRRFKKYPPKNNILGFYFLYTLLINDTAFSDFSKILKVYA